MPMVTQLVSAEAGSQTQVCLTLEAELSPTELCWEKTPPCEAYKHET